MLSAIECRALGIQPVPEAPAVDLSLATIVDAAGTLTYTYKKCKTQNIRGM